MLVQIFGSVQDSLLCNPIQTSTQENDSGVERLRSFLCRYVSFLKNAFSIRLLKEHASYCNIFQRKR